MANYKPTTGSGLTLTFDNQRLSLTASQSDETIPATGELDNGFLLVETAINLDLFSVSVNSGTNYIVFDSTMMGKTLNSSKNNLFINTIGNSTGRYKLVATADTGTRIFHFFISTLA